MPETDSRQYPDRPLVGVGGIVFQNDKVLLIRRGREPGRGRFSIPGGGVKLGETLEQALRREIGEETGLAVDPLALVELCDPGRGVAGRKRRPGSRVLSLDRAARNGTHARSGRSCPQREIFS